MFTCLHAFLGGLVAARALATYLIPGCVGRGSGWDLRIRPAPASASAVSGNLGTWKSWNLEIWEFGDLGPGNPEILRSGAWKSRNLGSKQNNNIRILKIRICSAQNVGKVWITRKKSSRAPFGAI